MAKNPYPEIVSLFNKLTLPQKITLGIGVAAAIFLMGLMLIFMNEPGYSTLFTNLQENDAAKIVEHLNSQKIPYNLTDEGQTIRVPQDMVYETRLKLSAQGIPGSGIIGYEIFDENTLGMSEFLQKLNFKRALEGELARTIMQNEGVDGVRVHIVTPEKSVFREEEEPPTASVLLKLSNSNSLATENIKSIIHLVSSSVEGLIPENVTLIDSRGRLLSKESHDNSLSAAGSRQYEIKQNVENYLVKKAQSLLDNVLGYGNSYIRVNAELDFDQVDKTMEIYDPESQVAISEQIMNTQNKDATIADSSANATENRIVNYQINKTIQRVIQGTGNIKKLTIAAVIDNTTEEVIEDDVVRYEKKPRSDEEMEKLEDLIKNAIGVDANRNDQFSIVNIPFENDVFGDQMQEELSSPIGFYKDYNKMTNFIFIIVAIGASLFIIRNLMQKLKNEKLVIGTVNSNYGGGATADTVMPNMQLGMEKTQQGALPKPAAELPEEDEDDNISLAKHKKKRTLDAGNIEDEITDEAHEKEEKQLKIANYVKDNPLEASKLINAWLHEDDI